MDYKDIIVTTTDLKENYEILDSLYVTEEIPRRQPKEEQLNQVLNIAKDRLRKQCQTLGGDAVIWCQISHFANYVTNSLSISGTAVKLKNK